MLVTDKLRRTEKLLCALGRGIPIVSKDWVTRSKSVNTILGKCHPDSTPKNYA